MLVDASMQSAYVCGVIVCMRISMICFTMYACVHVHAGVDVRWQGVLAVCSGSVQEVQRHVQVSLDHKYIIIRVYIYISVDHTSTSIILQ